MSQKKLTIPKHIAIIPDGNRRWAKKRGLKPWEGHLKGIGDFAQDIAWTAFDAGVGYLTIWGGSYDNLTKRSKIEVRMLNEAYRRFIRTTLEDERIYKHGVRVTFLGEWRKVLEAETIELIEKVQSSTKNHKNYHLTVLVAYNGDKEMIYALNARTIFDYFERRCVCLFRKLRASFGECGGVSSLGKLRRLITRSSLNARLPKTRVGSIFRWHGLCGGIMATFRP